VTRSLTPKSKIQAPRVHEIQRRPPLSLSVSLSLSLILAALLRTPMAHARRYFSDRRAIARVTLHTCARPLRVLGYGCVSYVPKMCARSAALVRRYRIKSGMQPWPTRVSLIAAFPLSPHDDLPERKTRTTLRPLRANAPRYFAVHSTRTRTRGLISLMWTIFQSRRTQVTDVSRALERSFRYTQQASKRIEQQEITYVRLHTCAHAHTRDLMVATRSRARVSLSLLRVCVCTFKSKRTHHARAHTHTHTHIHARTNI